MFVRHSRWTPVFLLLLLSACGPTGWSASEMQGVETMTSSELAGAAGSNQLLGTDSSAIAPTMTEDSASLAGVLGRAFGLGQADADVEDSTPPRFGALTRACGTARADLGEVIIKTAGFRIYDTNPASTALRPHYVTGFSDDCPRLFLSALTMAGDVGTHEIVRYSKTRVTLPYSATDEAYEDIKARFCRVENGKPCGSRLDKLGAVTTFITTYERFGDTPEWAEFLLHDGKVVATDLEGL